MSSSWLCTSYGVLVRHHFVVFSEKLLLMIELLAANTVLIRPGAQARTESQTIKAQLDNEISARYSIVSGIVHSISGAEYRLIQRGDEDWSNPNVFTLSSIPPFA
jgi:hypothetical protein